MTREQQKLVEDTLPFADKIIRRFLRKLPPYARDDVRSAAYEGLCNAAIDYDQSKGHGKIAFTTYAYRRILGGMLDECRRNDPSPRRDPGSMVIASLNSQARGSGGEHGEHLEVIDTVRGGPTGTARELIAQLDLGAALAQLTERERWVFEMRTSGHDGMSLARVLEVTESRVSQILHGAYDKIAEFLGRTYLDDVYSW